MRERKKEMTYNEKITHYNEKKNTGFAFIVIAIILFIIAAVFFFLSYKYNVLRVRVFVIGLEFFVAVISLAGSVILLTLGLIFIFNSIRNLKKIKNKD